MSTMQCMTLDRITPKQHNRVQRSNNDVGHMGAVELSVHITFDDCLKLKAAVNNMYMSPRYYWSNGSCAGGTTH